MFFLVAVLSASGELVSCRCEEKEVDLGVLVFKNKIPGHYEAVNYVQVRGKLT